ncbi:Cytochrome P450 [Penicillium lagena]|uniref:Cytochrome P450 n=1 Tax=Penicillium lagena TaxID=94218 RepID=UPI00254040FC|nr:Cytochrome P450 [Penicillium lagena]KAJ5606202.1 Cytochrome P450 [Penicillium lagena]
MMPPGLIDLFHLFDRVRAELVEIMRSKQSRAASDKFLGPTGKESVYDSVLDDPSLPDSEKTLLRLEQEVANPMIFHKLRTELSTASTGSWTELEKLPYLSAVIEEGNRLSFGVTARTARIAPESLTYSPSSHVKSPTTASQTYTIPPGTPISISTLSAHTAESVFPDPFTFDPGRWLGEEGRQCRKFQMAFSKGGRKCLGIELARAELYLVIAALVQEFDMTLWRTDASDVAFLHDYQVATPKLDSKGVQVKVTRAGSGMEI